MAPTTKTNQDTLIGRIVIDSGLATEEEVAACMRKKKEAGEKGPSLGSILITQGVITKRQFDRLKPDIEDQKGIAQTVAQIPGYQIIKQLGAGAMATVYLARQLSLDRLVAIKILPKKFTSSKEFIERFYAEGRAAGKLNHPNIVGALDVGKAGDLYYFVMEYVEGSSVFDELQANGAYAEPDALRLILQTARGLDHAHKAGFVHRDVKPKNIMITTDRIAKLADMGLARAIDDREAAEQEKGKAFGTPYYISPEQIRGLTDVDARADIYGLGATLYHMVTGQVPFDGPNPVAVMHRHLKDELTPPDRIQANLSQGTCEVIEVMMAKDRAKRYANTTDLIYDLEAVLKGEPPMQARQRIDILSLAQLEETSQDAPGGLMNAGSRAAANAPRPISEQPIFWIAIAGWVFGLVCLFALLIVALFGG